MDDDKDPCETYFIRSIDLDELRELVPKLEDSETKNRIAYILQYEIEKGEVIYPCINCGSRKLPEYEYCPECGTP